MMHNYMTVVTCVIIWLLPSLFVAAQSTPSCNISALVDDDQPAWILERTYASPSSDAVDFGAAVYVHDATILVGDALDGADGAGRAYIYPRANVDLTSESLVDIPLVLNGTSEIQALPQARRLLGSALASSGNTVVVGAPGDSSAIRRGGSVYIFNNNEATVTVVAATTPLQDEEFGAMVDIDEDVLIVGTNAGTAAYILERSSLVWGVGMVLVPDGTQIPSNLVSVAISGSTAVVGDATGASMGAVYVYRLFGPGNWQQQAKLQASDGFVGDGFGTAVDLDLNTIVVGAHESAGQSGAAYVFVSLFENGAFAWTEQAKLLPPNNSTLRSEDFGLNVAISGDTVVVADEAADSEMNSNVGAAYVFMRSLTSVNTIGDTIVWTLQQTLQSPSPYSREGFAASVSIYQDTIVVGSSPREVSGHAFVFTRQCAAPTDPDPTLTQAPTLAPVVDASNPTSGAAKSSAPWSMLLLLFMATTSLLVIDRVVSL